MAQVPQDQWDRLFSEFTKLFESRSPLRYLDQNARYKDGKVDTAVGFLLNVDGMTHVQYVTKLAQYKDPDTIALLQELAQADPARYPDRVEGINLANAILADVYAAPVAATQDVTWAGNPVAAAPAPAPVAYSAPAVASTNGQVIGQAYDSLEALQTSGVLTGSENATLQALIGVLQAKTKTEGTPA